MFKDDVESVLLFLGKMGIAHTIDVHDELELCEGLLEQYEVPSEVCTQESNLLTRVDRLLQELELKPVELIDKEPLSPDKTLKEILTDAQEKLSELEDRSKPFIEAINSSSNIVRKIDQTFSAWKIHPKKLLVGNISLPKESLGQLLLEAEHKLSDIERRFKEITNTSSRCLSILLKIDQISKGSKFKAKESPIEKVPFPPDEEFLRFIERTLREIAQNSKTTNETRDFHIKKLMTIKTTMHQILEQIPKMKADLIKQTLELRNLAGKVGHSVKASSELKAIYSDLLLLRETIKEVEDLIKVENKMGSCATTVYFEAWIPKEYLSKVADGIKEKTNGKCLIVEEPPAPGDTVPTIVKTTPRHFEAFEKLTFSLGYPLSDEVNPVLITAITFPILFGIMFADVGQGAILSIVGIILAYFRGKVNIENVGDIKRYLLMADGLLILCGVSAMFFGFIFGEFFGPSGFIHPVLLSKIGPFYFGGFDLMLEPVKMLRFAILIGVALLSLGLILRVINNIKMREIRPLLISICWLWLLLGGFFLWVYWGGISNIVKWFVEGSLMFLVLMVLPTLVICIVTATTKGIMEGIEYSIEIVIESLDHTISFTRLAALSLTHTALNYMFLIIGRAEHAYFSLHTIPVLIVGTILALSIEGLIIFVHCLRLHWVEWLPKFHSGKGIPFKPLEAK
jgi:V/A-type H+-transporting ATPase subunit I